MKIIDKSKLISKTLFSFNLKIGSDDVTDFEIGGAEASLSKDVSLAGRFQNISLP